MSGVDRLQGMAYRLVDGITVIDDEGDEVYTFTNYLDPQSRRVSPYAAGFFMRGYDIGHTRGYDAGYEAAKAEFRQWMGIK